MHDLPLHSCDPRAGEKCLIDLIAQSNTKSGIITTIIFFKGSCQLEQTNALYWNVADEGILGLSQEQFPKGNLSKLMSKQAQLLGRGPLWAVAKTQHSFLMKQLATFFWLPSNVSLFLFL